MKPEKLIIILGCTATGKTQLATHLARELDGEIISADSRQVFRGMDVGTGKDLKEFTLNNKQIQHHLINIKNAGEVYNVFEFQKDFLEAYETIIKQNKQAILCGGTGMYIESVVKGYRLLEVAKNEALRNELAPQSDEALVKILSDNKPLHNITDIKDRDRMVRAIEVAQYEKEHADLVNDFPTLNTKIFGVDLEREEIKEKITKRLKHRLKHEGMIAEVEQLMKEGVTADQLKFYGLEYKFITQFLLDEINRNELFEKLNIAIHQFAKRQATWFRRMEKNGVNINWIDGNLPMEEKLNLINTQLNE